MDTLSNTKKLLGELIAFPTISSNSNLDMIHHLALYLSNAKAEVEIWQDTTGSKANLFATIGPNVDGGIVLSGHSDVVPVADQDWTTDPFEMVERDEKLFGRGSCDMKGFIASVVAMAPQYALLDLKRPIHFAFTYDEEVGCFGAKALAESLRQYGIQPAVAIIGEPTSMRIIEGHKGCYEYTTQFTGFEGHGSSPEKGVNAVEYAAQYVNHLLELKSELRTRAPAQSRFDPPWTTINTGSLIGGVAHNVIPGKARVDWEMRPVQRSDADYVKDSLNRLCTHTLIPAMQAISPEANIITEVIGEVDGLEPVAQNEAREILRELTGAKEADVAPFGTEAGIFQDLGMTAVVCGPGSIDQAHKPDEYVSLDQISQCLEMLEGLCDRLT
ncbi:Acetylornithine deacetylase [Pseudovibrio axinellae]|uniref:Acetylornithine deacetylase n=1 Tax=Pseudovibrio axinellae TaxID=989403 RepID=A0A165W9B5_9HYPH|nr:acetylornithine deacetylase [Pseudovibrio axinellae]KZL16243.1 Acetylornithine deacetylase [Pseudovibrio axinellae]SER79801.1 acetylornithine deacetylase [Pseudovibrio axinellae]